jgi:hypothetical protein
LNYCEKKYFLNYYTFALKHIDQKLRETWIITKKLKTLDMWVWEKTHYLISDYLNLVKDHDDTEENIAKIKEGLAEEMRYEFDASKEKKYEELNFWEWGGLSEHYYWENIDDKLEETIEKVCHNLDQFISSEWINVIKENIDSDNIVYIENPKNPNYDAMRLFTRNVPELRNISIMASPDFWITYWNWKYLILDWKTGKEPEDTDFPDQIKTYALKVILKKNRSLELWDLEIEWYEVYIPSLDKLGWVIKQENIEAIVDKIISDTELQKKFLVNGDSFRNQPLPSSEFARTDDMEKCKSCVLRKVCEELKNYEN